MTATLCECRDGCNCEHTPALAVFSVTRDGKRLRVCGNCDLTTDTEVMMLDKSADKVLSLAMSDAGITARYQDGLWCVRSGDVVAHGDTLQSAASACYASVQWNSRRVGDAHRRADLVAADSLASYQSFDDPMPVALR